MFLKIEGHLLDVLGEKARGNIEQEFGIELKPEYQFLEHNPSVTLCKIIDPIKAEVLLNNTRITKLDTIEDFNREIDALYEEKYILSDSTALMMDLQLSGKTGADILNYDVNKSMSDQANLKALYDAGVSGITKNEKPHYSG